MGNFRSKHRVGWRTDSSNFATAGNGGAATTEAINIVELHLALPGIVAYWPLTDSSGSTVDNAEGTAALDATYAGTPTLAGAVFPSGIPVARFANGDPDYVQLPAAALNGVFNGTTGWLSIWHYDYNQSGAVAIYPISLYANATNWIYIQKSNASPGAMFQYHKGTSGGTYASMGNSGGAWRHTVITWNNTDINFYFDGVPASIYIDTSGVFNADLAAVLTRIAHGSADIAVGHAAIGAGSLPSAAEIAAIYDAVYPTRSQIVCCGDSKTADDPWPNLLAGLLSTATGNTWRLPTYGFAMTGRTADTLRALIETNIATMPVDTDIAAINIGVNNATSLPTEASFKGSLNSIIATLRGRAPAIEIYFSRIWMASQPANCATINGWIDDVIALYAYVHAGPDESVWLENGDNGATYTTDGTHYNAAGNIEAANQWVMALGY